jgi:twitching motility protein PilT
VGIELKLDSPSFDPLSAVLLSPIGERMSEAPRVALLGRVAVHLKMITMEQLAHATRLQGRGDPRHLADILVEEGFISEAQRMKLLAAQKQVLAKQRAAKAAEAAVAQTDAQPAVAPAQAPAPAAQAPAPQPAPPEPVQAPAPQPAPPEPVQAPAPQPAPPEPVQAPAPAAQAPAPEPAPPAQAPAASAEGAHSEPTVSGEASEVGKAEPAACAVSLPEPSAAESEVLQNVLRDAVQRGASDIHVHGGDGIRIRISGRLIDGPKLPDGATLDGVALSALSLAERRELAEEGQIDFCYELAGVARFRANAYRQHRGIDTVFRSISLEPPTLDTLNLPHTLARFTNYHQGMVLVTGPTGCGKSSTLAALVNLVNEERAEHIITIEDPIEYVHPSKRCLVNQRSVKRHTESFARALRASLREDPDVIVIGELRDLETISLAITAAETGHLVIASLHTENAIRTVNRLVGAFPADQQNQIRTMISDSLKVVVSQRLLPRADGDGLVPATEVMVVTKAVGNLIRENKTFQIHSILQTGASQGMVLLDDSIKALVKAGTVTLEDGLAQCQDPKRVQE